LIFQPTQLRTFLAVVEQGSARAAADLLHVSPAAVSSSLASLRRVVGVPLFERDGRGVKLTPGGISFLQDVRRIVALSGGAIVSAKAAMQDTRPPLRIGGVMTAGEAFLGELVATFMAAHPDLPIEVEIVSRETLWDRIAGRQVDMGFAEVPPNHRTLRLQAIRRSEYVVVAAGGKRHTKATLARATWFVREPGSGTRTASEDLFRDYDISPPICSVGSPATIIRCLREGVGVSLLPRDLIADDLRAGRLQVVRTPFTPRPRPWYFITAADRDMPPNVSRLLEFTLKTRIFMPPE
jgi:DNA-binding transcriptional LysR family regulator